MAGTGTKQARLGFLGTGWIGRHRMEAVLGSGRCEAIAICDPSPEMREAALMLAPNARVVDDLDGMLAQDLDGVVIATPSALHARQSIAALERGVAVFCQKPLGLTGEEVQAVIDAARASDVLLGVDFSYRLTSGMQAIRELVSRGDLGAVHAVDLVFHNAYGPDKDWFYDASRAGGGCIMDLGVHLVDLALWVLDFPNVDRVEGNLFSNGAPLRDRSHTVEDFGVATLTLATGTVVRLACSWRLHAGQDAVISADFYGRSGGAAFRNVGGSFYDFTAERFEGTARAQLSGPQDEWGGRAAADWARRLSDGARFDPDAERFVEVARVLDRIYATCAATGLR